MQNKKDNLGRRRFIGNTAVFAVATALTGPSLFASTRFPMAKPDSKISGVQVGVITYSFRSMPDQSAEATLQYVLDCGINAIELMGGPAESFAGKPLISYDGGVLRKLSREKRDGTLTTDQEKELAEIQEKAEAYKSEVVKWRTSVSMDRFKELRKMYKDAGVTIYAFKPDAFGKNNTDGEIDYGMRAAKALGATHVTLEHPADDVHTLKLAEMAKKHGIYVAYHGHEQQTPTFWDTALAQSEHNALNLDLGHYVAAGNTSPLEIIKDKHDRILSMHIKDRQSPEHGKGNLVWGKGNTPIGEALGLMRDKGYAFPATIELEYEIPEGSNAVEEVKKCLEYCKRVLE